MWRWSLTFATCWTHASFRLSLWLKLTLNLHSSLCTLVYIYKSDVRLPWLHIHATLHISVFRAHVEFLAHASAWLSALHVRWMWCLLCGCLCFGEHANNLVYMCANFILMVVHSLVLWRSFSELRSESYLHVWFVSPLNLAPERLRKQKWGRVKGRDHIYKLTWWNSGTCWPGPISWLQGRNGPTNDAVEFKL